MPPRAEGGAIVCQELITKSMPSWFEENRHVRDTTSWERTWCLSMTDWYCDSSSTICAGDNLTYDYLWGNYVYETAAATRL